MLESARLRIVFAGTPDFAADYLQSLLDSGHRPLAVYTQPDRPAGRGKKLSASPVKTLALDHQLPVYQPETLRDPQAQAELAALQPDLMIVVAYGLILPQAVLDLPRLGCINVHASLLPRWRGAAPVQRAIEAGDTQTGVSIMQMEAGLDTGPVLATASCPIEAEDTAGTLLARLAELGREPLLKTLQALANGTARPEPQDDEQACYAHKIDKREAEVDWSQAAETIARKVRAFNPFPVAYAPFKDQRVKIYRAEPAPSGGDYPPGTITEAGPESLSVNCGKGSLRILELQLPGKRPMSVRELLRGNKSLLAAGDRFGAAP